MSDHQATLVGNVFTQSETAVGMNAVHNNDIAILPGQAVGTLRKESGVFGRPPVVQVTFLIVVAALVVESVRHFVADYNTDSAIVNSIVSFRIEERRLQDGGRETNLVRCRIVISVYRLRAHSPTSLIDRFVYIRQHIIDFKDIGTAHVRPIRIIFDLQTAVVAPSVWITDLDDKGSQFLLRPRLSSIAHPLQAGDTVAQRFLQVTDHLQHFFFGRSREIFSHVHLADSFRQGAVDRRQSTFPTRLLFLPSGHRLAIEVKICRNKLIAQVRSGRAKQVECQIIFLFIQSRILHQGGQTFVERKLLRIQIFDLHHPHAFEINIPVQRVVLGFELFDRHLIIVLLGIAQVFTAERDFGNALFDLHDRIDSSFGLFGRASDQGKQAGNIVLIGFAHLLAAFVFQQVIIAIAHPQASLVQLHDIHGTVLFVGPDIQGEERSHPLFMQGSHHLGQFVLRTQFIDFSELILDRRITVFIQFHAIHSHCEQHADLLSDASLLPRSRTETFDKRTDLFLIIVPELVESTETGIFRFQRIILHPAATSVLIEIGPRSYGSIQVCQIDSVILCSLLHRSLAASHHCGHSGGNKQYHH